MTLCPVQLYVSADRCDFTNIVSFSMATRISSPESSQTCSPGALQVWLPVMEWYLKQRQQIEDEMKKYQNPPSDHLLPPLPSHAS